MKTIKCIKLGSIAILSLFGISGFLTVIQHCDPWILGIYPKPKIDF